MSNDSPVVRREAGPAVPGGAPAVGRIVDACLYEASLRSGLGLLQPAEDPAADSGTQVEAGRLAGMVGAMDRVGVRITCVVLRQEVEEFLRLRARHPGRLVGWAHYDSLQPERGLDAVQALCEGHAEAFVGVATAFACFGQDPRLKVFAPLYEYCVHRGLPVLLRAEGGPHAEMSPRPTAFGVLATVYPRLKLVCLTDGAIELTGTAGLLARFPNLFLATSGGRESDGASPDELPDLAALIRAVGSRQIMFASGGQVVAISADRSPEALSGVPWRHRANVSWRTAVRVFGPRLLAGC
jgi:predicted TIM-barrel fold metal-dependent hydrolase